MYENILKQFFVYTKNLAPPTQREHSRTKKQRIRKYSVGPKPSVEISSHLLYSTIMGIDWLDESPEQESNKSENIINFEKKLAEKTPHTSALSEATITNPDIITSEKLSLERARKALAHLNSDSPMRDREYLEDVVGTLEATERLRMRREKRVPIRTRINNVLRNIIPIKK